MVLPLKPPSGFNNDSFGCWVALPLGSRPADPHSTAVWCGNLLHSCPQPHTAGERNPALHPNGVIATTTKICTRGCFSQGQPQLGWQSSVSFLHTDALLGCHSSGELWDKFSFTDLGTIHFRSCRLRQVSCYTFLSGFQPSWPPSCYH